jgi:SAM-dependent methyltransferase
VSGSAFDYESAVWGAETIVPGERTIAGFRLREALALLPARGRVLELGCGAGRFLRAVQRARPALEVCGADVSVRALARAAELAPGTDLRRVAGPSAPLPARDREFDAVLALDVLEHVPDPERFLAEIARVLAPGGVFHLHVPCEGDPLSLWRWLPGQRGPDAWKFRLAGHVQRFRRRALLASIERAGFTIERVRYSLHLAGNLADVAAFAALAARRRSRRGDVTTTGDLLAQAARPEGAGALGALVRGVDALLWLEARLLARLPSWALHVGARRRG